MRDNQYLFANMDWHDVVRTQLQEMQKFVTSMDGNRLLNTSIDDLATYLEQEFHIEIPELLTEEIMADQRETKIDVSRDPNRTFFTRNGPFYITGTEIQVEIPFTGEAAMFSVRPSTFSMNPPCAEVRGARLVLRIIGTDLNTDKVRAEIDNTVNVFRDIFRPNPSGKSIRPMNISTGCESTTISAKFTGD